MPANLAHDLNEKERTADVKDEPGVTFETLLLSRKIQDGLTKSGFHKPSPIQLKAIPIGRCGFDLIVKAKSGTGKTLVFAVIALESVSVEKNVVQALILTPTREIAVQVVEAIRVVGSELIGLKVESFIGGLSFDEDVKKIKNCHIAVGAPGRIKHLIDKNHLKTSTIRLFVLDEADKLMGTSFQSDINQIYHRLPPRKQMIALSATYPDELDSFLGEYMQTPTHISLESETPMLLGLKQFVSATETCSNAVQAMKIKNRELLRLLSRVPFTQCLVFTNYQTRAESVSNIINQKGWKSAFVSAAQTQAKRLNAVSDLREFRCKVLLSTDLTSRGIDAQNVDLVINYDVPVDSATYLHRMGRAGRYGSHGLCINIVSSNRELDDLRRILGAIGGVSLSIAKVPPGDELDCDLWNVDYYSLEQIAAEVKSQADEIADIKKSVSDIRRGKSKNKKDGDASSKEEDCKPGSSSTAADKNNVSTDNKQEEDANAVAASRKSDSEPINCKNYGQFEDSKTPPPRELKRKRKQKPFVVGAALDPDLVYIENAALLSVTKLLTNKTLMDPIPDEIVAPIERYLEVTKIENLPGFHSFDPAAALKKMANPEEAASSDELEENLDNIYRRAFEFASGESPKDWRSFVPKDEREKFLASLVVKEEEEGENLLDYVEEEEMDEEEYYEENAEASGSDSKRANESGDKRQDLVERSYKSSHVEVYNVYTEPAYSEHFADCYRRCGDYLINGAASFESAPDFDAFYSQWIDRLQEIRNYVQQNVYVQEMSRYQRSKFGDRF